MSTDLSDELVSYVAVVGEERFSSFELFHVQKKV
jgi:hypothetical protein